MNRSVCWEGLPRSVSVKTSGWLFLCATVTVFSRH